MSNKGESSESTKDVLSQIQESANISASVAKLTKGPVEVTVNENQGELDVLKLDELTIRANMGKVDGSTDEGKSTLSEANSALEKITARRAELEKSNVRAYVVALSYRDHRIVHTAIAEAIMSVSGMGFDDSTKLVMVMQEKKIMTVYLTLREFTNPEKRFYKSLDEIAQVSDQTIDLAYEAYVKEFEIEPDERKK